jgi:hypothetical protein
MATLLKGAAALLVKKMLILCERAAASLVKRYGNVTQGCNCPSGKGNVNLCERVAASLVKRYTNFT